MMTINELMTTTGISQEKLSGMRLLDSKLNSPDQVLTSEDKKSIQTMLVSLVSDMSTNKKLTTIAPLSRHDTGIGAVVIGAVKDFSYRTRSLSKIDTDLNRIWEDFNAVKAGTKNLEKSEKITLKQFGMLYDLASLNRSLDEYNKLGLIEGNEELEQLYLKTQRAKEIISYLDNSFDQKFKAPTGSIVFDHTKSKAEIHGKELAIFEKAVTKVTKYGHASKTITIDTDENTENRISHINPNYKEEKFSLRNFLYSDVYRIKIENLIDRESQEILRKNLGDDWLTQLEKRYSMIERELHDNSMDMHNHVAAEGGAGRFASIATNKLQGGHKNFVKFDHTNNEVRDEVIGRGRWNIEDRQQSRMLCSEFVGKTVIAAVHELNEQVVQKLREDGAQDIPDRLIQSPISKREKLELLTPERLLTALVERDAIEKVSTPQEITQLVSKRETNATAPGAFQNFKQRLQNITDRKSQDDKKELLDENDSSLSIRPSF